MDMFTILSLITKDLPDVVAEKFEVDVEEVRAVFDDYFKEKTKLIKKAMRETKVEKEEKPVKKAEKAEEKKVEMKSAKKKETKPVEEKKEKVVAKEEKAREVPLKEKPDTKKKLNLVRKKMFGNLVVNENNLVYDMETKQFYGKLDEKNFDKNHPEKSVMPLSEKDIHYCMENKYSYRVQEDPSEESESSKEEESDNETQADVRQPSVKNTPLKETKEASKENDTSSDTEWEPNNIEEIDKRLEAIKDKKDTLLNIMTGEVMTTREAKEQRMIISKSYKLCGVSEEDVNLYEVEKDEEMTTIPADAPDISDKAEKATKDMKEKSPKSKDVVVTEKQVKDFLSLGDKDTTEQLKITASLTAKQQHYIAENEKDLRKLYKIK